MNSTRCPNCGSENLEEATFCEKCGARLKPLSPALQQPHPNAEGKILGIVPKVALVPFIGIVIGIFAAIFYVIGFYISWNNPVNADFGSAYGGWGDAGPFLVTGIALSIIAAVVFWGGILDMVRRSD